MDEWARFLRQRFMGGYKYGLSHRKFLCCRTGNIELKQTFSPVSITSITDISFWAMHPDPNVTLFAVDFFTRVAATMNF